MTMVDAAKEALKSLGRASTAREVHAEIVKRELFTFGAKDPVSVLGSAMRKHTQGSKSLRGAASFKSPDKGTYELL